MEWGAIIAAIAAISGVILGWTGKAHNNKHDAAQEAAAGAKLEQKVDTLIEKVDAVQGSIKDQGNKLDNVCDRVARVEESTKSAHHRLDRIDDILNRQNS